MQAFSTERYKKMEYRLIKRGHKDLAWGNPNQYYIDDQGNGYTNECYMSNAILRNVGWRRFPKSDEEAKE